MLFEICKDLLSEFIRNTFIGSGYVYESDDNYSVETDSDSDED